MEVHRFLARLRVQSQGVAYSVHALEESLSVSNSYFYSLQRKHCLSTIEHLGRQRIALPARRFRLRSIFLSQLPQLELALKHH